MMVRAHWCRLVSASCFGLAVGASTPAWAAMEVVCEKTPSLVTIRIRHSSMSKGLYSYFCNDPLPHDGEPRVENHNAINTTPDSQGWVTLTTSSGNGLTAKYCYATFGNGTISEKSTTVPCTPPAPQPQVPDFLTWCGWYPDQDDNAMATVAAGVDPAGFNAEATYTVSCTGWPTQSIARSQVKLADPKASYLFLDWKPANASKLPGYGLPQSCTISVGSKSHTYVCDKDVPAGSNLKFSTALQVPVAVALNGECKLNGASARRTFVVNNPRKDTATYNVSCTGSNGGPGFSLSAARTAGEFDPSGNAVIGTSLAAAAVNVSSCAFSIDGKDKSGAPLTGSKTVSCPAPSGPPQQVKSNSQDQFVDVMISCSPGVSGYYGFKAMGPDLAYGSYMLYCDGEKLTTATAGPNSQGNVTFTGFYPAASVLGKKCQILFEGKAADAGKVGASGIVTCSLPGSPPLRVEMTCQSDARLRTRLYFANTAPPRFGRYRIECVTKNRGGIPSPSTRVSEYGSPGAANRGRVLVGSVSFGDLAARGTPPVEYCRAFFESGDAAEPGDALVPSPSKASIFSEEVVCR